MGRVLVTLFSPGNPPMISVFRRKIDLATGLAPSIREMRALWSTLEAGITAWIESAFDSAADVSLVKLCSIPMRTAVTPIETQLQIKPRPTGLGLLIFVCFDRVLATRYAAQRMKQKPDHLEDVPAIFLQLINQDWADALCRELESNMSNLLGADDYMPALLGDDLRAGADKNVLQADFECVLEDMKIGVSIILELESLSDLVARSKSSGEEKKEFLSRSETLKSSVHMSPIKLEGVLDQKRLTIGECSRLEAGDIIVLEQGDREKIMVRAHTLQGMSSVAVGEIGAWKSQRAIRLVTGISEKFVRDLARE